jgi:hypothetical protein
VNPNSTPALSGVAGSPVIGGAVAFTLQAKPGSLAKIVLGFEPTHLALEPIFTGSLLALPAHVLGTWVVPPSGTLGIPAAIPPIWPLNQVLYLQFLTLEPGNAAAWASNSFPLLVKSP